MMPEDKETKRERVSQETNRRPDQPQRKNAQDTGDRDPEEEGSAGKTQV
jgi:hypothetical protein